MFGSKRKKRQLWNGEIGKLIEKDYSIQRRGNPDWPRILSELKFLDEAWAVDMNPHEAALMLMAHLFCGYVDNNLPDQAKKMYPEMMSVAERHRIDGEIRDEHWERMSDVIAESFKRLGSPYPQAKTPELQ